MYSLSAGTLPSAQQNHGAILVLPDDIGLYREVFDRWEKITLNHMDDPSKTWSDNKSKIDYMENLLGEDEKLIWIQWRMMYPKAYEDVLKQANETQNIISQVRRIFFLEDPYQGMTDEQDRAYKELERLSCNNLRDIWDYFRDYKTLIAKSGRMFLGMELSEKLFRKLPPLIGKELEDAWVGKYTQPVA